MGAKSAVLDLAIGNKWQWSNFTLGCDWIGVMVPIAQISKKDDLTDDGSLSRSDQNHKDTANELAKVTNLQFLRFYLGVAF